MIRKLQIKDTVMGAYEKIIQSVRKLKEIGVQFGVSVTVERNNSEYWIKLAELKEYQEMGVKLAFFLEHTLVDADGKEIERVLAKEERKELRKSILIFERKILL